MTKATKFYIVIITLTTFLYSSHFTFSSPVNTNEEISSPSSLNKVHEHNQIEIIKDHIHNHLHGDSSSSSESDSSTGSSSSGSRRSSIGDPRNLATANDDDPDNGLWWLWDLWDDDIFHLPSGAYPIGYRGAYFPGQNYSDSIVLPPSNSNPEKEMIGPGVYITDSLGLAKSYATLYKPSSANPLVCKMYVMDKYSWRHYPKVWIPKDPKYYRRDGEMNRQQLSRNISVLLSTFDEIPQTADAAPYQMVIPPHLVQATGVKKACLKLEKVQGKQREHFLSYKDRSFRWHIGGEVPHY